MSKPIELARKLAALAAPGSGASDSERSTAAQQLGELIAKHGLGVTEEAPDTRRVRQPHEPKRRETPPPARPRYYPQPAGFGDYTAPPRPEPQRVNIGGVVYDFWEDEQVAKVAYSESSPVREPSFYEGHTVGPSTCDKCGKILMGGERCMRRAIYGVIHYLHPHCYRADDYPRQ